MIACWKVVHLAARHFSTLNRILDMNVWGRDRDRAVERSPALEFLDELFCVVVSYPFHPEAEAHGVEQRHVRSHRLGAIHQALDSDVNSL